VTAGGTKVRAGEPRDAPALAALHVRAWQAAYQGLIDDGFLRSLSAADREAAWLGRLADPAIMTLVAEEAGHLVGLLAAGRSRDPNDPASAAEVYSITVEAARWRRRIGSALLGQAVERLRDAGFAELVL
jgi:ribosomal protein S18 acetylase RimI-like enzyme